MYLLDACFGQNLQSLLAQNQPNVEIGPVRRVTHFGAVTLKMAASWPRV